MTDTNDTHRDALRVTRFVGAARASVTAAAKEHMLLLEVPERGSICVQKSLLVLMARGGLVEHASGQVVLTAAGRALARSPRRPDILPEGIGDIALIDIDDGSGTQSALVNLSESPLAQLARHRTRDGRSFLEVGEVNAGERLRSDYTRGMIMPRLGANWVATVASGRRDGAGGAAELTDAALAARLRVEKAIAAVGPELSGVLLDVCCYLKGLERIEAERGWPVRSAKIVLKTALAALSRHYDPKAARRERPRMLHWGSDDYRPSING